VRDERPEEEQRLVAPAVRAAPRQLVGLPDLDLVVEEREQRLRVAARERVVHRPHHVLGVLRADRSACHEPTSLGVHLLDIKINEVETDCQDVQHLAVEIV
jgi:hypothetical protein